MSDMVTWRKSSHSGGSNDMSNCVEVARLPGTIGLRDSKNTSGAHHSVSPKAFMGLVKKIKSNGLDL